MVEKIFLVVEDLLFLSKILETAQRLGVTVEAVDPGSLQERLAAENPCAIILDLNHRSGRAIQFISDIKKNGAGQSVPVIGFLSHVQSGLAQAAREAGCDQVLARSAFTQRLPQILRQIESPK